MRCTTSQRSSRWPTGRPHRQAAIPSPTILHFRGGRAGVDRDRLSGHGGFFADLAKVYREEIAALYQAGCRYVQIDETNLPFLCDPKLQGALQRASADPNALARDTSRC